MFDPLAVRFYVAIFGLPAATECERWGDGWGRRRLEAQGVSHGRALAHPRLPVHRFTSDNTTWLADSATLLPSTVVGDGTEGYPVDYMDTSNRLIFIADPDGDLPNKFEPFSPTLFRPRGSCIAPFPRAGEYRIAVWSDDAQTTPKRFSVGLGLAERDVFSPKNLMLFDFTLMRIHSWNGFHPIVLLLPIVLSLVLLTAALLIIKYRAPDHFGTTTGLPTPFRAMACTGGAILLGHSVMNMAILGWATSNSNASGEYMFALVTGIVLPVLNGAATLMIGLRVGNPCCCCCCPGPITPSAHFGHRLFLLVPGVLHVMLHAGYLVAPILLLIAAALPPSIANAGLTSNAVPEMHSSTKGKVEGGVSMTTSVAATPTTPTFTELESNA